MSNSSSLPSLPPPPRRPPAAQLATSTIGTNQQHSSSSSSSSSSMSRRVAARSLLTRAATLTSTYITPKLEAGIEGITTRVQERKERRAGEEGVARPQEVRAFGQNVHAYASFGGERSFESSLNPGRRSREASGNGEMTDGAAAGGASLQSNAQSQAGRGWGVTSSIYSLTGYFSASAKAARSTAYISTFSPTVVLFGGWATLLPSPTTSANHDEPALRVEVVLSGYAYRSRPLKQASRSQKMFYSLATSFAALPRLPATSTSGTEEGVSLNEENDVEASAEDLEEGGVQENDLNEGNVLERLMEVSGGGGGLVDEPEPIESTEKGTTPLERDIKAAAAHSNLAHEGYESPSRRSTMPSSGTQTPNKTTSSSPNSVHSDPWPKPFTYTTSDLPRLHGNLNTRLLPFFGQKLSSRKVRLSIYLAPSTSSSSFGYDTCLASKIVTTSLGGGFKTSLQVGGKELMSLLNDPTLSGELDGMPLRVVAELLEVEEVADEKKMSAGKGLVGGEDLKVCAEDSRDVLVGTDGGVRVISDIDDTVKWTEVLGGTRKIFRNVFVRELQEIRASLTSQLLWRFVLTLPVRLLFFQVPGMADWYTAMRLTNSTQFHYVSNGPQELYPLLAEFLRSAGFPIGSVTLKEYGGASQALAKLWEEPGMRKRRGVEEVIKEFPHSKFILVGDSGEQDLQLYVALAQEYPSRILAIYIRDVTTPFSPDSHPDLTSTRRPTSVKGDTTPSRTQPSSPSSILQALPPTFSNLAILEDNTSDPLSPNNPLRPEVAPNTAVAPGTQSEESVALVEAFWARLVEAERVLPAGVKLRIFRHGAECKEEGVEFCRRG